jgi:hypothetical protein
MDTIHTLNEHLIQLFDESGVARAFTVPYDDEPTYAHVVEVGRAAHKAGGFTVNLLLVGDGITVAYPSDVLDSVTIRKDSAPAKAALATAHDLIGDGPADKKAVLGILDLVGQLEGISLLDFAVALIQLVSCPIIPSDMFTLPSAGARGQKTNRIQQMLLVG